MNGKILIKDIYKSYKVFASPWDKLKVLLGLHKVASYDTKTVISQFNLEVNAGEAVGIVGFNGAGKSTILKLLAGTSLPTSGEIHVSGRTSALLELGIGFHPDFSGRENIYIAGQLMGYTSRQTADALEWIIEFSELGGKINQPLRTYSSGMQMRLAFALATAYRPDVLIIDEALAVGDVSFQHKCFERIKSFKSDGTTLLLVSHDKNAILTMCDRAILVHGGQKILDAKPVEVFDLYNALAAKHVEGEIEQKLLSDGAIQTISGSRIAEVEHIDLVGTDSLTVNLIDIGQPVRLVAKIHVHETVRNLVFGFAIKDNYGQDMFGTNTALLDVVIGEVPAGKTVDISFDTKMNLGEGQYTISTSLSENVDHLNSNIQWKDFAYRFQIINKSNVRFTGKALLPVDLNCLKVH